MCKKYSTRGRVERLIPYKEKQGNALIVILYFLVVWLADLILQLLYFVDQDISKCYYYLFLVVERTIREPLELVCLVLTITMLIHCAVALKATVTKCL